MTLEDEHRLYQNVENEESVTMSLRQYQSLKDRIAELETHKKAVEDAMREVRARGVVIYAHTVTDILDKHLSRLKEEPKP